MSVSFKVENVSISAARDRAMFNTFAGNQSYVIEGIGDELAVSSTPNSFVVTLGTGEAVICGGSMISTAESDMLTLGNNESGYIVIEVDLSQAGSNICRFTSVPSLVQQNINDGSEYVYDLPLYQYTTSSEGVQNMVDIRDIKSTMLSYDNIKSSLGFTPVKSVNNISASSNGNININSLLGDIKYDELTNVDLNTITNNFYGYVVNCTNQPTSANNQGELLCISRNKETYNMCLQIYSPYNSQDFWERNYNNGTWSAWRPFNKGLYTSVTQLGQTSGSATISACYDALPLNSELVCVAYDFATSEVPSTFGLVVIRKTRDVARTSIEFFGKEEQYGDYRMFLTSAGSPTGNWLPQVRGDSLSGIDLQTLTQNYMGYVSNVTNAPGNYKSGNLIVVQRADSGTPYITQIFSPDSDFSVWIKKRQGSNIWTVWQSVRLDTQECFDVVDIKNITLSTSGMIANASSGTCTASVPTSISNYSEIRYFVQGCNYGYATGQPQVSNGNVTLNCYNVSGASHTLVAYVTAVFLLKTSTS